MTENTRITFWFDPICPFTWRTSRWARQTAPRHGYAVNWQVMSLGILNEGAEVPEQFRELARHAPRLHRLLVATSDGHGQEAVDRLYTAIGGRLHEHGQPPGTDLMAGALADAGLPAELVAAADDTSYDEAVRASHEEGQKRVGTPSGSPITAFGDGPAYFGPVVVPVPTAASADRLFEALRLLAGVPEFSELRRARNPF